MTPFSRRNHHQHEITSLLTITEEELRDEVTDISALSNLIGNIKGIFSDRSGPVNISFPHQRGIYNPENHFDRIRKYTGVMRRNASTHKLLPDVDDNVFKEEDEDEVSECPETPTSEISFPSNMLHNHSDNV